MKSFLINLLKFAIYSLAVYVIALVIFGLFAPDILKKNLNYKLGGSGFLYSRIREIENQHNIDILFIGSSHAYRGYDTRIFSKHNIRSFNLGSSSQPPTVSKIFIEKYIDHLAPKTVIFDIYPRSLGSDGVESSLDVLANEKIDYSSLLLAFTVNHIKTYNVLIYSWFRQILDLDKRFVEPMHKDADTYIKGGYVESYENYKIKAPAEKFTYKLNTDQLKAFKQIITIFKKKKIPYILIQAPISQKLYNSITNNAEIDSLCSQYGKYYNFNKTLKLPDSLFIDDNHLNQHGVNVFNSSLIKTLHLDSGLVVKH